MKIYTFIAAVSLFITTACAQSQNPQADNVKHVSAKEFSEIIVKGGGQLIDIRTPGEYNQGHIDGAVMIDFYAPTYRQNLDKLDKNIPIYIYCRSGNRTGQSVRVLHELGFKEIVNLQRGLIDWQRNGLNLATI